MNEGLSLACRKQVPNGTPPIESMKLAFQKSGAVINVSGRRISYLSREHCEDSTRAIHGGRQVEASRDRWGPAPGSVVAGRTLLSTGVARIETRWKKRPHRIQVQSGEREG